MKLDARPRGVPSIRPGVRGLWGGATPVGLKPPIDLLASLLLVTATCGDNSNLADPPEPLFVQSSDTATLADSICTIGGEVVNDAVELQNPSLALL